MSKRRRPSGPKHLLQSPAQVADGVQIELRAILRRWELLRRPFEQFVQVAGRPADQPRWRLVSFTSYEAVQEEVLAFAGGVWHLKDRLKSWVQIKRLRLNLSIEKWAETNPPLLVCADLINAKKHGGPGDRSAYAPFLSGVQLLFPPQAGVLGMRYDGVNVLDELLMTNPVPVPWRIELWTGDGKGTLGDAVELIGRAFASWVPVIRNLKVLGADVRSRRLDAKLDDVLAWQSGLASVS
jgi:hypothetical protein